MTDFVSKHTHTMLVSVWFVLCLDPLFFPPHIQPVRDDETRIIFIKNISPDKAKELCNTWKKHSHVVNFLPLLNKVNQPSRYVFFCGHSAVLFIIIIYWSYQTAF